MTATEPRTYNLPRNVRPSWLSATIDGRASNIDAGPRARSGKMFVEIAIRQRGGILDDYVAVDVVPSADGAATTIRVRVAGKTIHEETVQQ